MKVSFNHLAKPGSTGENQSHLVDHPTIYQTYTRGSPHKKKVLPVLSLSSLSNNRAMEFSLC